MKEVKNRNGWLVFILFMLSILLLDYLDVSIEIISLMFILLFFVIMLIIIISLKIKRLADVKRKLESGSYFKDILIAIISISSLYLIFYGYMTGYFYWKGTQIYLDKQMMPITFYSSFYLGFTLFLFLLIISMLGIYYKLKKRH